MAEAVVIGVSAGGMEALKIILPALPAGFSLPVIVVQHLSGQSGSFLYDYLNSLSAITVKEAEDKEPLLPAHAYLAPPGYHLLVEADRSLSLSIDARVNYSCPSIDVLFESAVDTFGPQLIGIVLTGANNDGAAGLRKIAEAGGATIVQNPANAQAPFMPRAAIAAATPDYIVELTEIAPLLTALSQKEEAYGKAASL